MAAVPPEEVEAWIGLAANWGERMGQFVPLNPLVARFVQAEIAAGSIPSTPDPADSVFHLIRYTAARQHLDGVLVYEVWSEGESDMNPLILAELSIVGAFLMPSRSQEATAHAAAILVDPCNGHPYGTAQAEARIPA